MDVVAGGCGLRAEGREVDVQQASGPLADAAGDQNGVDVAGVRAEDDGADGIVQGEVVDLVGGDHQEVGLLARGECAGRRTEADGRGALAGGEVQHVGGGDPVRRPVRAVDVTGRVYGVDGVDGAHPLDRVQRPHLGEHVARQCHLDVDAQAGPDARRQGVVHRRDGVLQADLRLGGRGERHPGTARADGPPRLSGQPGGVDQGQPVAEQARALPVEHRRGGGPAEHRVHADADAQFGRDAGQPGTERQGGTGDLRRREGGQAERDQPGAAAVPVDQPAEVGRPLPVPVAEVRPHRRVDPADPAVQQRLHGRVGVLGRPGVVREVEHRGDARVHGAEGGQPGPHVHVLGPVHGRVPGQRGAHVARQVVDVGDDPAQLALPGVAVGVDEAGGQDRAGGVDDDRVRRLSAGPQVGADGGDGATDHQQVTGGQGAEGGVHGDDGGAGEQDAPPGVAVGAAQQVEQRGPGGVGGSVDGADGADGVHGGPFVRRGGGRSAGLSHGRRSVTRRPGGGAPGARGTARRHGRRRSR